MSDITLKEYMESQVRWLDRHIETQLCIVREEISKADGQLTERLARMNEFRESLKDQTAQFITKAEYYAAHSSMEERVRQSELNAAKRTGEVKTNAIYASTVVSIVVGIIVGLVLHWINKPNIP